MIITELNPQEIIEYALKLKQVQHFKEDDIERIRVAESQKILLSYFSNNILHCFILPACVALIVQQFNEQNLVLSRAELMQKMQAIYPYLKQEFFLAWAPQDLAQEIEKIVAYFIQQNWMTETNQQLLPNLITQHEFYALAELAKPSLNNFVLIQGLLLHYSQHIPLNLKVLEKMAKTILQRAADSAQF